MMFWQLFVVHVLVPLPLCLLAWWVTGKIYR
jgi:hypothetical protein